jgi:hypothetical protein
MVTVLKGLGTRKRSQLFMTQAFSADMITGKTGAPVT